MCWRMMCLLGVPPSKQWLGSGAQASPWPGSGYGVAGYKGGYLQSPEGEDEEGR